MVDSRVSELAARQQGVVSRAQLLERGVSRHQIEHRLSVGRLRPLFRGIYQFGPVAGKYARETAGVLACGSTAFLSHRSAAALWGLYPGPAPGEPVEVGIQRGYRPPSRGLIVRRNKVRPDELTEREALRVTRPARTILDLAATQPPRAVERALAAGTREGLLTQSRIQVLLGRYPRRAGAPTLRALLNGPVDPAFTRSEAESRFLDLVRKARVEAPEVNVVVSGYEVDFLWRDAGLVVEVDGFAFHSSRQAFEVDRTRDGALALAGYRVIRVTWSQLKKEPEAVLVRLGAMLAAARSSPTRS